MSTTMPPLEPLPTGNINENYELRSLPRSSSLRRSEIEDFIQSVPRNSSNGCLDFEKQVPFSIATVSTSSSTNLRLSKQQNRKPFLALCWCIWVMGWNDGSIGPLLPRMQQKYKVGFSVVSLIFVGNCLGYIVGGALNVWLNDRLGFGKTIVLGSVCQLFSYVVIIPAPPFPLLICGYVILGFGLALQNGQANGFIGSLNKDVSRKLGIMHAAYGLGAFTSPFASTYFSGFNDRRWSYHFIISLGLALMNISSLIYVFRFRRQEDVFLEAGQEPSADSSVPQRSGNPYKQIFSLNSVPLLALFALIYVGVEVTLGGWIVTFIIQKRHGGHNSGYISSGFFGGLTLGRIGLMWLNEIVGEYRIIIFYSLIAIGLELTIWLVPSIIGNAVVISLIGMVLGPMFPLLVKHMSHIYPARLLTGCVGLVTGIGVAGSAVLPFITGILASKYGIGSLQPLMISMISVMLIMWLFVPKKRRVE